MHQNFPLFIKFQTAEGYYVLDSGTNEILSVSPVAYAIIDDFMAVDKEVIVQKHSASYGSALVFQAIEALSAITEKKIFDTRFPRKSFDVSGLLLDDTRYTFNDFINTFSKQLIIELTQNCNLECSYCVFGAYYSRHPARGTSSIPLELAKRAIKTHLDKTKSDRTISFYGGEPLLEYDLLCELVLFAEQYSESTSKPKPTFSLTTNGTLLRDEVIHFFVEHDCHVLLSIDGDRQSHDRYRTFKGSGTGTFDLVEKNLRRFSELYPNYYKRGLILTLTTLTDFYRTNEFLKKHVSSYPAIIANFADPFLGFKNTALGVECDKNACVKIPQQHSHYAIPEFLD